MTGQASEGLRPSDALREAVHRFKAASFDGIRERIFTFAFKGLVYPQIWEDPEVDLKALELKPGARDGRDRLGRLQRALLSDRRPGVDPRRRPQSRACRADQAEARGDPPAPLLRVVLPLLRRGRCARQPRPPIAASSASRSTRRRAATGRAATFSAAGASRSSSATSTATACSAPSSARRISWRGSTAPIPRKMMGATTLDEQRSYLRRDARAALRQAAGALAHLEEDLALRSRHSAGAIRGAALARRRHGGGAARAAGAPRLRLLALRQLFRLAGLRPRLSPRAATGPLPPYLRRQNFDDIRARAGAREGGAQLRHRRADERDAGEPRRLRAPRRAGLDDRRAAERALGGDHAHREAGRARRLPHRRRAVAPSRPRRRGDPRPLDLRRRRRAARSAPRTARRSMAASTSTSSTDERRR